MFVIEIRTGEPVAAGGVRLVSIARSVRLELGRIAVGWHRALGVSVQAVERETMVPIHDHTRRLQLAILGVGLLGSLLLKFSGRRRPGARRAK